MPLLHEGCAINALSPRKMKDECPCPRDVHERCTNVREDPINGRSRERYERNHLRGHPMASAARDEAQSK